jgi:tRNA-Thr(GGU) m(6)t(6)A37 methyltransferase TsaA
MKAPDFQGLSQPQASLCFIGRIRTPFTNRDDCPRSIRAARVNGGTATAEIDPVFRPGILGLDRASHVILLYWMDEAERDCLVQTPKHLGEPRGVFAIRSPARPNPIAIAVSRLIAVDAEAGALTLEQMDCRDGTPLLDVKPYWPSIDSVPDALPPT